MFDHAAVITFIDGATLDDGSIIEPMDKEYLRLNLLLACEYCRQLEEKLQKIADLCEKVV
jgi:hypothetical protein